VSNGAETLWAVVVGAILATAGGFAATRLEELVRRRERERSAALLFGEILSALELIAEFANAARERGDPYGTLTMRLLRAVRRETEVYDRNRESLYDLRDAKLRVQIHTLMVRVTLALEGVFDATSQIAMAQDAAVALGPDDPARAEAMARVDALVADRQAAFDFAMESVSKTKPIISVLRPLAKQTFDARAALDRDS
jgi:hypothetical protein